MLKISLIVLVSALLLPVVAIAESAASSSQSKQPATPTINLESLLTEAGYKPIKLREGLWGVSGLAYQGQNLKKLDTFLEVNPHNGLLRITARIGFHDQQDENVELKRVLESLTKRLDPTEFSLTKQSLFAAIELPVDKLDGILLARAINKAAGEADKAYPEVEKFINKLPGPESLGPGAGEGFGAGRGGGVGRGDQDKAGSNPGTSESSKSVGVDSRPVILYRPRPAYTEEARNNKTQGAVLLRVLVDATGVAKNIRVVRGLPDGLNEQAIDAVSKTKFKPAMKDGHPVDYTMLLEVGFSLR